MIKDIVVNLGLGASDPAGDYAVSIAEAFGAHVLGVAVSYDPVIPGTVMGGVPPEVIESQRAESNKKARTAIARFEQAAKRAGVSLETRVLNTSVSGAADRSGASEGASISSLSVSRNARIPCRMKWSMKVCCSNPAGR